MSKADPQPDPAYGRSCATQGTAACPVLYRCLSVTLQRRMAKPGVGVSGNVVDKNADSYILFDQITWIIFLYLIVSVLNA